MAQEPREKLCACGSLMKVAAIDVGTRFHCPTCQAQSFDRTTYQLDDQELGGADPLVYLVRRRVASDETRDVPLAAISGGALPDPQMIARKKSSERTVLPPPDGTAPIDLDSDSTSDVTRLAPPVSDSSKLGMGILPPNARL